MKGRDFKLLNLKEIQLIDIREKWELELYGIKTATHIPKDELMSRTDELDKTQPVYLICHTGMRTSFMSIVLSNAGYNVIDVEGGYREYYDYIVD